MAYSLPPNNLTNGTAGLEQLLIYEAGQVPMLVPGILLFILIIITAGGYFSQERRVGKGNFAMWLCIGSFISGILAFILFLIPGLLNIEFLVIMIAITLMSTLWFLFSNK